MTQQRDAPMLQGDSRRLIWRSITTYIPVCCWVLDEERARCDRVCRSGELRESGMLRRVEERPRELGRSKDASLRGIPTRSAAQAWLARYCRRVRTGVGRSRGLYSCCSDETRLKSRRKGQRQAGRSQNGKTDGGGAVDTHQLKIGRGAEQGKRANGPLLPPSGNGRWEMPEKVAGVRELTSSRTNSRHHITA